MTLTLSGHVAFLVRLGAELWERKDTGKTDAGQGMGMASTQSLNRQGYIWQVGKIPGTTGLGRLDSQESFDATTEAVFVGNALPWCGDVLEGMWGCEG